VNTEDNIKTITQIYEAFGRGDVATILESLTDDVDWAAEGASSVPGWYGVRHGKDEVAAFFTAFGSAMEVEDFTPITLAGNDTDVLTVVHCRSRSRSTVKSIDMYLDLFFRLRYVKIAYYRGSEVT
jgi:ketosteroid isomerase-like protein